MKHKPKKCKVRDCNRCDRIVQGFCHLHYERYRKYGDPNIVKKPSKNMRVCKVAGCRGTKNCRYVKGYCNSHYLMMLRHGDPLYVAPLKEKLKCLVNKCGSLATRRGFCGKHYLRFMNHGDPDVLLIQRTNGLCRVEDCNVEQNCKGFCRTHYLRYMKHGDPNVGAKKIRGSCSIQGCFEPHFGKGFCNLHWRRWKEYGNDLVELTKPKARAKGTGSISNGYIVLKIGNKRIAEHRLAMEILLGRELHDDETVHHINGNTLDNRIENLELWKSNHPSGQRVADLLEWANKIIEQYGNKKKKLTTASKPNKKLAGRK